MKKQTLLSLILATTLFISSCSNHSQNSRENLTNSSTQSESEEINDTNNNIGTNSNIENQAPPNALQGVSIGLKHENEAFQTYVGEPISITYIYGADGSKSVGIKILCDGISIPFSTDKTNGESKLHIIPVLPNFEENEITLTFTPMGNKGDEVEIQINDIVEPDFDINTIKKSDTGLWDTEEFFVGMKYKSNFLNNIKVVMEKDGLPKNTDIDKTFDKRKLTDEELNAYITVQDNCDVHNALEHLNTKSHVNGENREFVTVKKGEKLDIFIEYAGTDGADIVTSVYIDNEIYPAFNGKTYSFCNADSTHSTTLKGVINTAELEVGRHICYGIFAVNENVSSQVIHPFILEVQE